MYPLSFPTKTVRTGVGVVGASALNGAGKHGPLVPASFYSGVALDSFIFLRLSGSIQPTENFKGWNNKRVK